MVRVSKLTGIFQPILVTIILVSFAATVRGQVDSGAPGSEMADARFEPLVTESLPQKVVYVGANKKFERTSNWMAFLKSNFATVVHVRSSQFRAEDFTDFDVFVFDLEQARLATAGNGSMVSVSSANPPVLPTTFDRAAILVGSSGVDLANANQLIFDGL